MFVNGNLAPSQSSVIPPEADQLHIGQGAWSIDWISALSFGLPPFGWVPSFGFRIANLKSIGHGAAGRYGDGEIRGHGDTGKRQRAKGSRPDDRGSISMISRS